MKGYLIVSNGRIFQATKPETLELLKEVANGKEVDGIDPDTFKDLGPITVDVSKLTPETAEKLFADISLGRK